MSVKKPIGFVNKISICDFSRNYNVLKHNFKVWRLNQFEIDFYICRKAFNLYVYREKKIPDDGLRISGSRIPSANHRELQPF